MGMIVICCSSGEPCKVEVKEPPQGAPPPVQTVKKTHPPNKVMHHTTVCVCVCVCVRERERERELKLKLENFILLGL